MTDYLTRSPEPDALDVHILQPQPRKGPLPIRAVGPGRLERGYQRQIAQLNGAVGHLQQGHRVLERRLETARLVERGTERYVNRVEADLERERQEGKRMMVALGSLHREHQAILAEMARLEQAMATRIEARPRGQRTAGRAGLWGRLGALFGGASSGVRTKRA